MNNLINVSLETLADIRKDAAENFVLSGLPRGKIGFVVSGPDVGKTYLSLSIAYEVSTRISILGVRGSDEPLKVLYWPIEDGPELIATRIIPQLSSFSEQTRELISANFSIWSEQEPFCTVRHGHDIQPKDGSRNRLIEAAKSFDLLIIDTLREAAGNAHEVDDETLVKCILQDIAKQADVAILVTHHLTKDVVRGKEKITNVSGSGYSAAQANARLIYSLEKRGTKTLFSHLKANYLNNDHRFDERELFWSNEGILSRYPNGIIEPEKQGESASQKKSPLLDESDDIAALLASRRIIEDEEPSVIVLNGDKISQSTRELTRKAREESAILTEHDRALLAEFREKKRRSVKDRKDPK